MRRASFCLRRAGGVVTTGFVPPPYPYDRLDAFKKLCAEHEGGIVDLSIGDPCDAPAPAVVAALSTSNAERGYPPSIGIEPLRVAARDWMRRRFDVDVPLTQVAACVGSKEFVATTAHWLRLRDPSRDTVLYPAVAYPTYEMGAIFANCRPVAVPMRADGSLDLASISPDDAKRAVMIWSNSPSNPTGALDDLGAVVEWGRRHGVPVVPTSLSPSLRSTMTTVSQSSARRIDDDSSARHTCCRSGRGSTSHSPQAVSTCGSMPSTDGSSPSDSHVKVGRS
ncbi:MAG: aminotransferase class I/II-fold pyridoxal phosphate-dependent enzyme [Actinobacteria bacterium]|nr:aminotransferase class I/II-fold pyridoxal phosphate-dependent enzyme [Actinomycetota bacterium]